MRLVVDASVAVKWFLGSRPGEDFVAEAVAVATLLDRPETELYAPEHWTVEVLAVVARIDPSNIDDVLLALHDMRPRVQSGPLVHRRAAELAVSLSHHMFDTLYHAAAMQTGATLVTADKIYFDKAVGLGAIEYLPNFRLPPPGAST